MNATFWTSGEDIAIPTIALTKEASAKLLGLNPALYSEHAERLSRQVDEARAEYLHWERMVEAEEDEAVWRVYERRCDLALERYVTLLGLWTDLVEKLGAGK